MTVVGVKSLRRVLRLLLRPRVATAGGAVQPPGVPPLLGDASSASGERQARVRAHHRALRRGASRQAPVGLRSLLRVRVGIGRGILASRANKSTERWARQLQRVQAEVVVELLCVKRARITPVPVKPGRFTSATASAWREEAMAPVSPEESCGPWVWGQGCR